jgi:RHS repeat-associated protein
VLFTGAGGAVVEERRYEPFGSPIDASGASGSGQVDFASLDVDSLNHATDPSTGWSDAGARWFQPETARWQVLDPPTLEGQDKYAAEPWSLNPYQYTDSNPILYWDPDGRDKADVWKAPAVNTNLAPGQTLTATVAYAPILLPGGVKFWPLPTQAQLAGDATVKAAFTSAWNDSFSKGQNDLHEQGGWIYWNPATGLSIKRQTAGAGAAIPLWNPPVVDGSMVVGVFHTHPNASSDGWAPDPSPPDVHNAAIRNVPSFVVSDQGVFAYGATSYGSTGTVKLTNP